MNTDKAYINGIGLISPQKTAGDSGFLTEIVEYNTDWLKCIEPSYRDFIEPLQARRMSRLIKMGIAAARMCLADGPPLCSPPGGDMGGVDAIITGTGLGSVEDTEKILGTIHLDQPFLNPTPFMQSTYNTISSQIAIHLKCHGYNSTYVHRSFSFESGLQDALMQLDEGSAENILAGGIDEMTMNHLNIVRRLGEWKMEPFNNLELLSYKTKGALAGEGAGYFLVSSDLNEKTYCSLRGVATMYRPLSSEEISQWISEMLDSCRIPMNDIDLVILGLNGDREPDNLYTEIINQVFEQKPLAYYKHMSGEYYTSAAFALWAAANIIRTQTCPEILKVNGFTSTSFKNILIYNHFRGINHSVMIVSG